MIYHINYAIPINHGIRVNDFDYFWSDLALRMIWSKNIILGENPHKITQNVVKNGAGRTSFYTENVTFLTRHDIR